MITNIPKITESIQLSDYAPEFGAEIINVWLNPPQRLYGTLRESFDGVEKQITEEQAAPLANILAQLWSVQPDEVMQLIVQSLDTDPMLPVWLVLRTITMINDHRLAVKKNWMRRSLPLPGGERPASR